ncbi:DLW-39 family protein [Sinomonas susongensis]|nr:DLW-39 family protein [Sinomonas susongensis]
MKKLIAFAIAAAAGVFVFKRMQDSEAQKKVWSTTTDIVE